MSEKRHRAAIIGCGQVGATSAYSLLMGGYVEELILVGRSAGKLHGEINDLRRATPLAHPVSIHKGSFQSAAQADIVIIAAGTLPKPNDSSLDALKRNITVVRKITEKLKQYKFGGIILIITNPVDVLAQVAQEESGLQATRVIGSGKSFLMLPFLPAVSDETPKYKARSIPLPVIGKPEIATWCAARTGGGAPLIDFCTPDCPEFDKILEDARHTAPPLESSKRCASFAVGTCVNRICEAVLRGERMILPVSAMTGGQYGVSGVYMNLPCVVGRGGIERIVELPLDDDEKQGLVNSAENLKGIYESLKSSEEFSIAAVK